MTASLVMATALGLVVGATMMSTPGAARALDPTGTPTTSASPAADPADSGSPDPSAGPAPEGSPSPEPEASVPPSPEPEASASPTPEPAESPSAEPAPLAAEADRSLGDVRPMLAGDPWQCDAFGYLFQSPRSGGHHIIRVNLVTGASQQIGQTDNWVNAAGYNVLDDYVYAWEGVSASIVRIAADGTSESIGPTEGLDTNPSYVVGDVDDKGHYWMMAPFAGGRSGTWSEVDLAPLDGGPSRVVASGTIQAPDGFNSLPADWAHIDGMLYGVEKTTNDAEPAHLLGFDTATHELRDLGPLSRTAGQATPFGAVFVDASGYLYTSNNRSGAIFRIDPDTRRTDHLSNGPTSFGNDGVRCPSAAIPAITVTKEVGGRVQPEDQFTVSLSDGDRVLTSATTEGAQASASLDWPLTQFRSYRITDAMAAGSPNALSAYVPSIQCRDAVTGDEVAVAGSAPEWTIRIATDHAYACTVTNTPDIGSYEVSKTSSAGGTVTAGEPNTYTVSVTNTGDVPYTEANPATVSDDLSSVLEDASFDGTVTATLDGTPVGGASYDSSTQTVSWAGALPIGATVDVTYTVQVTGGGDGRLVNTARPDNPTGTCSVCSVTDLVRAFTVEKTSTAQSFAPGETVPYAITVTNRGAVDYTAASPASFQDDLSEVLDDATYNDDATHGAVFADETLEWSGPLAAGASVTITYSVTVDTPPAGDRELRNVVHTPRGAGGNCLLDSVEPECRVELTERSFTVEITTDKATAAPDDVVQYTLTLHNTGQIAYTADAPASLTNDLGAVLDDAAYNGDASAGAVVNGSTLTWAGPLAVGASQTVTYSVTVDSPVHGDYLLQNSVRATDPSGTCAPDGVCEVVTAVSSYTVAKSVSAERVHPGETLTYTIEVTNVGRVAYTDDAPASFTDDLTELLEHADYNGDADGGATLTDAVLSWSGPLPIGESRAVSFSVTVHEDAPVGATLRNAVVAPPTSGSPCQPGAPAGDCVTETVVDSPDDGLPVTGGTAGILLPLLGTGLALGGLLLLMLRRGRNGGRGGLRV